MIIKNLDPNTVIAWASIENFKQVSDSETEVMISCHINHTEKKRQFIAARQLLRQLVNANVVISYDQYGGPIIENLSSNEISLSHSNEMVAAACSNKPIGIDIQQQTDTLLRIKARFMNADELKNAELSDLLLYTQYCWSAKEAMFKAYRKGKIDFRLQLKPMVPPDLIHLNHFQSIGYLLVENKILSMKLDFFKYVNYTIVSAILI